MLCRRSLLPELQVVEALVEAGARDQLFVTAGLHDLAVFYDDNLVGFQNRAEPVGENEGGPIFHQAFHGVLDEAFAFGVERAGGFVEDEETRVFQDRAGDGDALPLAAAEFDATFADGAVVAVRELEDEVMGVGGFGGFNDRRHVGVGAMGEDVLPEVAGDAVAEALEDEAVEVLEDAFQNEVGEEDQHQGFLQLPIALRQGDIEHVFDDHRLRQAQGGDGKDQDDGQRDQALVALQVLQKTAEFFHCRRPLKSHRQAKEQKAPPGPKPSSRPAERPVDETGYEALRPAAEDPEETQGDLPAAVPAGTENHLRHVGRRLALERTHPRRAVVPDQVVEERGVGVAGKNRDDIDAGVVDFGTERVAEGAEGEFAGAVNRVARRGNDAEDAGDVDDLAGALLAHYREDGLDAAEGPEEIDFHDGPGVGGFGFFDGRTHAEAGVVDEDVDATKFFEGGLDEPGDVGVVGDIGDDREQVGVSGGELPERRFVAGRDDDTSTGTGEGERGFFADAAGGTGNDDDLFFHCRYGIKAVG